MEILYYTVYCDNGRGGAGAYFSEAYVGCYAGGYHGSVYDVHKRYAKKTFWKFIGVCAVFGVLLLIYKMASGSGFSYISDRIQSWKNPESDPSGKTFQTYESLLSIGSGGWFGLGFGESRQKYYLPESQNDFVFAIICEELGFVGAMVVVLLFVLFIIEGFMIASRSKDRFGMLLAAGITIQIGSQALFNIMVACNAFPNTGISLPFFSYGGTALMIQLAEMGIMLNVSRQCIKKSKEVLVLCSEFYLQAEVRQVM